MKELLLIMLLTFTYANGYKIFYMDRLGSCRSGLVEINVGALSQNSSGILMGAFDSSFQPRLNCTVYLRPPLSYGIVISIRSINLLPAAENSEDCENYIKISPVNRHKFVKLCGYSYDGFEYQSYTYWGGMQISFHTSNISHQQKAAFQLTFTAIRKDNFFCSRSETRCRNQNCIWKDLTCDGHNNCGDLSDELDRYISQCKKMTPGESIAVIIVTIVGSLMLLICVVYLRGPKLTRQIERLSQDRPSSRNPTVQSEIDPAVCAVPTLNRPQTNYGAMNQFLTSSDLRDNVFRDPPPRYEDIIGSSTVSQVSLTLPYTSANNMHDGVPQRRASDTRGRHQNYFAAILPQNSSRQNDTRNGNNNIENSSHGS